MRLQFKLNQIKIEPSCHIQLTQHAEEYLNKNVTGLLYGKLSENYIDALEEHQEASKKLK